MNAHAVKLLCEAKALIAKPRTWTKGRLFRERNGVTCRCVDGAVSDAREDAIREHRVTVADAVDARVSVYLSAAAHARGFETASRFNDAPETTHADALALFDEAIALATAAPK
jgi:hypothetical protein